MDVPSGYGDSGGAPDQELFGSSDRAEQSSGSEQSSSDSDGGGGSGRARKSSAHIRMLFLDDLPVLPDAACKSIRLPLWDLALEDETRVERAARHHNAKAVCGSCPVKQKCRAWAETHRGSKLITGVWGGVVFAPEWFYYPRCAVCDVALALSRYAIRHTPTGHRPVSQESDEMCSACAVSHPAELAALLAKPKPPPRPPRRRKPKKPPATDELPDAADAPDESADSAPGTATCDTINHDTTG